VLGRTGNRIVMMSTLPSAVTEAARRRVVLIDFDWQDADLLPRLLQRPGFSIRLVAGERTEDAGLRMAEVCGLPRTLDLADLTREIFDLALVSDRSLRRARVQSLLEALRTPCLSPLEFLAREEGKAAAPPASASADDAPPAPDATRPGRAGESAAAEPAAPADAAAERKSPAPMEPGLAESARLGTAAPRVQAARPPASAAREAAKAPVAAEPAKPSPAPETAEAPATPEVAKAPAAPEVAKAHAIPEVAKASYAPEAAKAAAPEAAKAAAPEAAKAAAPEAAPAPPAKAAAAAGAEDFDSVVEQALEGMTRAVATVRAQSRSTDRPRTLENLQNFPSPEDRAALEAALRQLVLNTGAVSAELHAGRVNLMKLIQVGAQDPLLEGIVGLALQLNSPQIIKGLTSPNEGKLWGAWPFRTIQHRGVLAASAIDPEGGVSSWEKMVDEMRQRWDQQDRESAVRSFPLLPGQERAWLGADDFRARLLLAVERNKFDGLPFTLHRLEFPGPDAAMDRMCEGLPQLLRGSDYLLRMPPRHVLLLTAVPADDYTHVRRRLLAAWENAWRECGQTPPAPPITDLRAEMAGPEDAEGFLASADGWLSP
jgi:hypothetical protein